MSTERGELAAELQTVIARKGEPGKLSWVGKLAEMIGIAARSHDAQAERLAAIEARLAALEAAPVEMTGVYKAGTTYRRGHLVISDGSLWFCRAETTDSRPGGTADWQLCVRKARLTESDR